MTKMIIETNYFPKEICRECRIGKYEDFDEVEESIFKQIDIKKVRYLIRRVKDVKKIEWDGGTPIGQKTEEGKDILSWPYPVYPRSTVQTLAILGSDEEFDKHYEKAINKDADDMCLKDIRTMLTYISQGERFCDGLLAEYVEDGSLLKMLRRINQLYKIYKD